MLYIINVKMDESVLEKRTSFKILGFSFSSKFDCGSYIISVVKSVSCKIGVLIHSIQFFPPEVGLYFYKSTIWPKWNTAVMTGLVLLAAPWKC